MGGRGRGAGGFLLCRDPGLLAKYKRWHRKVKIEPGSTCRFTHDSTYHCILSRGFLSVLHGVEESLYKTCKRHACRYNLCIVT